MKNFPSIKERLIYSNKIIDLLEFFYSNPPIVYYNYSNNFDNIISLIKYPYGINLLIYCGLSLENRIIMYI